MFAVTCLLPSVLYLPNRAVLANYYQARTWSVFAETVTCESVV